MGDLRRPSLRLAVGLAVVVLGLVEVQALVQTLRGQTRLRERVMRSVRDAVVVALPRIAVALRRGGPAAWSEAAREATRSSLASEFEVFDPSGDRLLAYPDISHADHWPTPAELGTLEAGRPLTLGPVTGEASRVMTYALARSGERTVLLRFSTAVPELVEDLRERRQLLVGHGVALVVLVLAAGLALFPAGDDRTPSTPSALHAYEEAMARLRDRDQALSLQHEAERRRMEEEIQDKEALARAGELTAGIVHEVRNGLGTILGYARLMERSTATPETVDAARRIREECETLETVVRRFMDFVRRETLNLAPFDLARMLSRVVARESRSRPGGDVSILEGDLGTLKGDEELLERAFENLVRNAREAAGEGGKVSIGVRRQGERISVTVADDGPGLPSGGAKDLRPFYSTKAGGLGLGLPIALKIVRLHGGELVLGDRDPHGLSVTVRLPADRPRA